MSSDPRIPARRFVAVCFLVVSGLAAAAAPAADTGPVFSGEKAMAYLVEQCELGPRTPGSAANRALQERIVLAAKQAGLAARRHRFVIDDPFGSGRIEACNVIVSTPGDGTEERLWLGAHFDTRPVSDRDPDPARRTEPLTGANDGASGTAVLLHLIELLGETPPPQGVDLLFFDAEDSGHSGSVEEFCLGSRRLAGTLEDFSNPLVGVRPRGLILLDMVGEANLRIPMEGYSLRYAPDWTAAVFERAAELGLPAFVAAPGAAVYDDHVPFLGKGIPAVDLIDFQFPEWHTTGDVPSVCSPGSLEQVGSLLVSLIYRP